MNIQLIILCSLITSSLYAQESTFDPTSLKSSDRHGKATADKQDAPQEETSRTEYTSQQKKDFPFQFENKDLVDIINLIAAKKGVNIVLPQRPDIFKAISTSKITFYVPEKMSIDEAWELLYTILDIAGYAIKPQGNMFAIVPIPDAPGTITPEPMPTFIGTPFDDLPDGDIRIRYVHYLASMKVPSSPGAPTQENEVIAILSHMSILPANAPSNVPGATTFVTDGNANAVILMGKADTIKGAMAIIRQLDKGGFHEKIEIVTLKHTSAPDVKKLFIEGLLKSVAPAAPHMRNDTRKPGETYFAPNTRIIDEPRTNSLIIVGRAQAVDRIKDFIETYIDIEPDSGKSILHVYTLLYLDAQQMVPVLDRVIGLKDAGGAGQARAEGKPVGGPERFFDTVIIRSDKPDGSQANADDKSSSKYQYSGGNRLIVAARNDDWKRIKALLEQLDKPFPQVFIEVLIADISMDDIRQLGQQTRNLHGCLPSQINIQSAQLNAPIVDTSFAPGTIAGNLLANTVTNPAPPPATTTLAGLATPGSTVISFNKDDETWSLLQLLRSFNATKIISHPHVVCVNNKPSTISVGSTRLVLGEAALGTQAANIKQDPIKALLEVKITPRISADNIINLNVDITINTFAANTPGFLNTINTREVHTNANIRNKSILALGGLITDEIDDTENETPLLSKVPILGWFFKNRRSEGTRENLTVFISPTVIMPNLRGGIHQHAKDYIGLAKEYATEASLFDSLRDPVTRFFFNTGTVEAAKAMDEFVKDDETLNSDSRPKAPGRKLQKRQDKTKTLVQKENRTLKDVIEAHEANPLLSSTRKKTTSAAVA